MYSEKVSSTKSGRTYWQDAEAGKEAELRLNPEDRHLDLPKNCANSSNQGQGQPGRTSS